MKKEHKQYLIMAAIAAVLFYFFYLRPKQVAKAGTGSTTGGNNGTAGGGTTTGTGGNTPATGGGTAPTGSSDRPDPGSATAPGTGIGLASGYQEYSGGTLMVYDHGTGTSFPAPDGVKYADMSSVSGAKQLFFTGITKG